MRVSYILCSTWGRQCSVVMMMMRRLNQFKQVESNDFSFLSFHVSSFVFISEKSLSFNDKKSKKNFPHSRVCYSSPKITLMYARFL